MAETYAVSRYSIKQRDAKMAACGAAAAQKLQRKPARCSGAQREKRSEK
jgi:hypothetical protein